MSSPDGTAPLVTAAVVCYNHARFVIEALESVKAQAYPNLHLIVIDDCSKDGSADIIWEWLNENWLDAVFIANKTNMGVCRTANDALANAKGKYFRGLAGDDRWVPNTLCRQVGMMEGIAEDVGVLYSDAFQMDERGELLPRMFIETHRSLARMPEGRIFDTLLEGNFIPAMSALIRVSCIHAVGGYDENLSSEDWDMWLRISRRFMFRYFPEPTACYRVLSTSMTRRMTDEIIESEQRMFVKLLRRGWIPRKMKAKAVRAEFSVACQAYCRGLPNRVQEAAWVLRHQPNIRHALLLLCVAAGLPYPRFEQLIIRLGAMRRRAGRILAGRGPGREPR